MIPSWCKKDHVHDFIIWTRSFDDMPLERRHFRTWKGLVEYINNQGCECCSWGPRIEKIKLGKLYEFGYAGSFRLLGCCAQDPEDV